MIDIKYVRKNKLEEKILSLQNMNFNNIKIITYIKKCLTHEVVKSKKELRK